MTVKRISGTSANNKIWCRVTLDFEPESIVNFMQTCFSFVDQHLWCWSTEDSKFFIYFRKKVHAQRFDKCTGSLARKGKK